jgi:flagellin-like protein
MVENGLKPVIRKKDKAVSPIIATILLVAITVILASTLYLALGGFFKTGATATPTAALSVTSGGASNYTLSVGSISSTSVSINSVEIEIFINGTGHFSAALSTGPLWHGIGSTGFNYNITTSPSGTYVASGMTIVVGPATSHPGASGAIVTGFELYYTGSPAGGLESGPVSS